MHFKYCKIKTEAVIFFAATLLQCGVGFAAPAIIASEDFESASAQKPPMGWSGPLKIELVPDSGNKSKYLVGSSSSKAGSAPAETKLTFAPITGPFAVEFRMRGLENKTWSTFLALGAGEQELFKVNTVNLTLRALTVPGTSPQNIVAGFPAIAWRDVRLEFDTSRENNNLQVWVQGRLVGILTVPALYTVSIDWLAFGYLAAIDDLKITSGPDSFNPPANPEKFLIINPGAVKKRTPEQGISRSIDPMDLFLKNTPEIIKTLSEEKRGDVLVRKVIFLSRSVQPQYGLIESEVYAVIARPVAAGQYPGLLILHGGMGLAEEDKAVAWASCGYITMAIDVPGVANPTKAIHSRGVAQLPYGLNRFSADPDATTSPFFDGILAGAQAVKLLKSQPDIIADRVGVTGVSWGGFTATGVAGVCGDQLKAVFAVFGCGYIDRTGMKEQLDKLSATELEAWCTYVDAGRRAKNIKASYFINAPANDVHFWPSAVSATLAEIPGEKNQLITPNEGHKATVPGGTINSDGRTWLKMEVDFFDWNLKGKGYPLPRVTVDPRVRSVDDSQKVRVGFYVEAPVKINSAKVFYSTDQNKPWPERKWIESPVDQQSDGSFMAELPANAPSGVDWFAMVSDARPVSVSSTMQHIPSPNVAE